MEETKTAAPVNVTICSETPVEILKRVGITTYIDAHPKTPVPTRIGLLSTGCHCFGASPEECRAICRKDDHNDDVGIGTIIANLIASDKPEDSTPVGDRERFFGGWCYRWNIHRKVQLYCRKIISADNMTFDNLVPGLLWAEETKCDIICIPHTGRIDATARRLLDNLGRSGVLTIVSAQSVEAALETPDTLCSLVGIIPGLVAAGGLWKNFKEVKPYSSPAYMLPVEGATSLFPQSCRIQRWTNVYCPSACALLTALVAFLHTAGCGDRVEELLPLIVQRLSPGVKCNPVFHFKAVDDIRCLRDPVWVYPKFNEFVNQPLRLYCASRRVARSIVRLDCDSEFQLQSHSICSDYQLIGAFLKQANPSDWPDKTCFKFRMFLETTVKLRPVDACECAIACTELLAHALPDLSSDPTTWDLLRQAGHALRSVGAQASKSLVFNRIPAPVQDVLRRFEFSAEDRSITHAFLDFKQRAKQVTSWSTSMVRESRSGCSYECNVRVHAASVVPVSEHGMETVPFLVVELQCSDDGHLVYCFCVKFSFSMFPLSEFICELGTLTAEGHEFKILYKLRKQESS